MVLTELGLCSAASLLMVLAFIIGCKCNCNCTQPAQTHIIVDAPKYEAYLDCPPRYEDPSSINNKIIK